MTFLQRLGIPSGKELQAADATTERLQRKEELGKKLKRKEKVKLDEALALRERYNTQIGKALGGAIVLATTVGVGATLNSDGDGETQHSTVASAKEYSTKPVSEEQPILETTSPYTSVLIGNEGSVLHVISWIHGSKVGMNMAKKELNIVLKKDRPNRIAFEGFPSGEVISMQEAINPKLKIVLDFAQSQGAHLYGGDSLYYIHGSKTLMAYIMQNGSKKPNDEICLTMHGVEKLSQKRTRILLDTVNELKTKHPESRAIGMMGAAHFARYNRDEVTRFTREHDVRVALHVNKATFNNNEPGGWSTEHCGPFSEMKEKSAKTLERVLKEEGLK